MKIAGQDRRHCLLNSSNHGSSEKEMRCCNEEPSCRMRGDHLVTKRPAKSPLRLLLEEGGKRDLMRCLARKGSSSSREAWNGSIEAGVAAVQASRPVQSIQPLIIAVFQAWSRIGRGTEDPCTEWVAVGMLLRFTNPIDYTMFHRTTHYALRIQVLHRPTTAMRRLKGR